MEEQTEEKISLLTWHPYRNLFSFVSKNTVHSYCNYFLLLFLFYLIFFNINFS